jgi:hypothetical protein
MQTDEWEEEQPLKQFPKCQLKLLPETGSGSLQCMCQGMLCDFKETSSSYSMEMRFSVREGKKNIRFYKVALYEGKKVKKSIIYDSGSVVKP